MYESIGETGMSLQQIEMINLNNKLELASFFYHVLSKPELEDEVYDQLFHKLLDLEKQYPEFKVEGGITSRVGNTPLEGLTKVKHTKPLLSLKNVFDVNDIIKELPIVHGKVSYIANAKLDGVALSLIYRDGKLEKAVTRGDGEEGEDVTAAARMILNIPKVLNAWVDYLEVRGEVVMPKAAFHKLNRRLEDKGEKPYVNTRNAVSGILRLLNPDEVASRPLAFFVYGVGDWQNDERAGLTPESLSTALVRLNRLGFSHKRFSTCLESDPVELQKWFNKQVNNYTELREDYDVDIDGIVFAFDNFEIRKRTGFTSTYPKYAVAYKFPASSIVSTLEEVEWQVGRTGVITPVAHITPVKLHGVTVSRVTLHNLAEIRRLDVMVQDKVVVTRQGDVIPKIKSVISDLRTGKEEKINPPQECPCCAKSTYIDQDGTFLYCLNSSCNAQFVTRLEHFASRDAMNIKGLGISIIKLLVGKGLLGDITDIYRLKDMKEQLLNIDGFGETSVDNLLESIENSKKTDLYRLIYALGIPGVGEVAAKNICKHFYNDIGRIINPNQDYSKIPDIGSVTSKSLKVFFSNTINLDQINYLLEQLTWIDYLDHKQYFKGQTWVVTGSFKLKPRRTWQWELTHAGANVTGIVTSNTTYLLVGEGTDDGKKLKTAKQLGITIVTEDELFEMIEHAERYNLDSIEFQ